MANTNNLLLSVNIIFVALISASFLITLLGEKDELELYAFNNSLKNSVVIVILSLIGYSFYLLSVGKSIISINVIFFSIEGLGLLSIIFYFLELKGISFLIKIKNKKLANVLIYISIAVSVFSTISLIFTPKFFANNTGLIRYDELILYVNVILLGLIIPMFPTIRGKLTREEYKKEQKEINKMFNLFLLIYLIFMVGLIGYVIYKTAI
ncbi:hypothetical protein [Clostridium ganghwense]|uniref:Uncharacterized protein n=1 Tax=Clostridium ganghwense TaxID=312089 RepID=A0ABT4CSJ1_9CLOT|nr:hypothetical protein [Clostridium ganghwense]MCY6372040.1 hypothetical protein [Clostridium ganghwense]